jgi:excisionase family DNA binding protein
MMSPLEVNMLADAIADRITARLGARIDDDAMLDSHQAAELRGCSVATIERLTRSGELPSEKFGRLRRYRRADVLAMKKGGPDHA